MKRLRSLLPDPLVRVLRVFKHALVPPSSVTFDGVYATLGDVEKHHPHTGYDDELILGEREHAASEKWGRGNQWENFPAAGPLSPVHNLMPLLVATLLEQQAKVRILDFGGGLGDGFIDCCQTLAKSKNLEYHVTEMEDTQARARTIFVGESRVVFHNALPATQEKFDLVYVGSSLQYIADYRSLLNHLAALSKRYVFLTNHFMGGAPTYATAQKNMGTKVIPYWILNRAEVAGILENSGMSLIYRSANYQPFHDFSNFPEFYRVQDSCNLLFGRR